MRGKKPEGAEVDYVSFGFKCVIGKKMFHLRVEERIKTQCGLNHLLPLQVKVAGHRLWSNCEKTVRVVDGFGKKICIIKNVDGEMKALAGPKSAKPKKKVKGVAANG
jgi:hypothetical protein